MTTIRASPIEAKVPKKSMTKKAAVKSVVEEKTVKKVVKAESSKKTSSKKAVEKKVVEVETVAVVAVEKTVRKINVKPTLADTQGLNLSVAKVKNIISNLCINKETSIALKEMKASDLDAPVVGEEAPVVDRSAFTLAGLSAETIAYLDECSQSTIEAKGLLHSRKVIKNMSTEASAAYVEAKKIATETFQAEQKAGHLFQEFEFNLTKFNLTYDPKFYSGMDSTDADWKSLEGAALYEHAVNLVNKNKVRFNAESKIFITAFVEYIIKQLVINGTQNCIDDKKKIIQLFHALDKTSAEFTMVPFITSTSTYKRYASSVATADDEADTTEDVEVEDNADRKLQFKYYVAELCRNVRMEMSSSDDAEFLESKYNQTSVSKTFKEFCSDVIIELLQMFGNVLKTEVVTRDVKTVNYAIVNALIQNSHILHNIDYAQTVAFIQAKYNIHSTFLEERSSIRVAPATSV